MNNSKEKWVCPNNCDIDHILVCGGENLEEIDSDNALANIYFIMTLDGEYTNQRADGTIGVPNFCYEHADEGCCSEPICPECRAECIKI